MTRLRRRILAILDVPLRTREIAEFLGVPEERVTDAIRSLAERGEIVKDGPYWARGEEGS